MRRPSTTLRTELPLLAWLVIVWGALWQDFSPGNLLFGALIALVVTRVFYLPPVELSGRFNVLHAVRYAFVFVWHVIVASVQLTWLALAKGPAVRSAVIAVPLRSHADLMVTATGHVISLVPGSLVVDVDRANATLYVHYIDVETEADADRVRREVLGVEAELIRIMGTREELALVAEEQHLDRMMSAERGEGGIR
ncbi:Na+/H+ antiporter subunit E [Sinomonas cellulolyticus]|jgi:multicomponent Na+:H+ antiporter subunit E|uniref:Na+/H+ antiporter subunit E n=1 Tax=Sinomonas cellulolyticus TaxID=2801916 RepID=A0ABS1JX72_9MICC|nr:MULTISPECIES: Na+/H+ antiporter subunit E [Sinomonas]MBL0703936.1 Na+/H+ antiporter subunit E [Sinomonas cellulolyticus]GHG57733.1 Na+/H+ antiporter subunit E [Sinomonas sp. KCTC 49339]